MPAPHAVVSQTSALFTLAFPKNGIGAEKLPPVPVGYMYPPDVIPAIVVVPVRLPLNMGRPMGLGVGVMVLLPTTMIGAAAEGKFVMDGVFVVDPAVVMIGMDCWNHRVSAM